MPRFAGLLRYARKHTSQRTPQNVRRIIDATVELMAYHFRSGNIEVIRTHEDGLAAVVGDYNELQQVFVNILRSSDIWEPLHSDFLEPHTAAAVESLAFAPVSVPVFRLSLLLE